MESNGLGELIRRERTRRGWTQADLGDRIGVDRSYISQIETNARKWPQELIPALSDTLKIPEVDMAVAAGLIRPLANRSTAPVTTQEDPVRADLVEKLQTVRLTDERTETIEDILDRWIRRDRNASEYVQHSPRQGNEFNVT